MDYIGKTAVITGAASGLGRGIARACAARGMNLVLADINVTRLLEVEQELRDSGLEVLALPANVAEVDDMERLAYRAFERFGAVHLLFNNAGVMGRVSMLEAMIKDWEWIMGVNIWGVINGMRAFIPRMLESGQAGRVVNIAGAAGFLDGPGAGIYQMTKHAVVSLSESLYHEMQMRSSQVGVSVVSPDYVKTGIMEGERNRPAKMQSFATIPTANQLEESIQDFFVRQIKAAPTPEIAAEEIFIGIEQNKLYIFIPAQLQKPMTRSLIRQRMENIVLEHNPGTFIPGAGH